jgi:hypothetical protein
MTSKYATCEDTLPNFICATCGGRAGDTENTGVMVHGGYGSARYDTSSLVWTVRGESVYPRGHICDDCTTRAVSEGLLEEFHSAVGDADTGLYLSKAAYRELFAFGARQAYDAFWAKREGRPYQEAREPAALEAAIDDMRYRLSGDQVLASGTLMKRSPIGWGAVDIGYAHAVAAIVFGCGEADPSFEKTAETWGRARKTLDAEIDSCGPSIEKMFGALKDEGAQADDEQA